MTTAGSRLAAGAIIATLGAMQGSCVTAQGGGEGWMQAPSEAVPQPLQLRGATPADAAPDAGPHATPEDLRAVAADLSVRLRGLQEEPDSPILQAAEAEVRGLAQRLELLSAALGTPVARFEPVWGVPDPLAPARDPVESAFAAAPALEGARSLMHSVRLASFDSPADAIAGWPALVERHGALLAGLDPRLETVTLPGGGMRVELKVGPIASRDDAEVRCVALAQTGAECAVDDFSGRRLDEAARGDRIAQETERVIG